MSGPDTVKSDGTVMFTIDVELPDGEQTVFTMPTIPCHDIYKADAWKRYFQELAQRFTDPKITRALAVCSYLNRQCFLPKQQGLVLESATCDIQNSKTGNDWMNADCGQCLFQGNVCTRYALFFREFFQVQSIFQKTVPKGIVQHESIRNFIQTLVQTVCGQDIDMAQLELMITDEFILFIAQLLGTPPEQTGAQGWYTKYAWILWPVISFSVIMVLMIVLKLTAKPV